MIRLTLAAAVVILSALVPAQIVVDASQTAGTIKDLQGVNTGPLGGQTTQYDLTAWFRRMRISSVRTHDFYGPCDIPVIFPNQNLSPTDPTAYDFASSDQKILAIANAGCEVYLRLGTSWNQSLWQITTSFANIAEVCRRIVMHYNQGWNNGYYLNIRRIEFWNEPNGTQFWDLTPQDFYSLYAQTAALIKADDPTVKIGTCGLAGAAAGPYREGLIAYCAQNAVPLDFFSWHRYGFVNTGPFALNTVAQTIRQILDTNGFTQAEQDITEWNLALGSSMNSILTSVPGARFTAATLNYLQDAGVTRSHHYRGDVFTGTSAYNMGLFTDPSTPNPRGWVYLMSGRLQLTPERLAVTGTNTTGLSAVAGRVPGGGGDIQVLATEYPGTPSPRTLTVQNLASGRHLVERWGFDQAGAFGLLSSELAQVSGPLVLNLPANGFVELIRIRPAPGTDPVLAIDDAAPPYQKVAYGFSITGPAALGGAQYLVGISLSGTSPGTTFGSVTVPLIIDAATLAGIALVGQPGFPGLAGTLDPQGRAVGACDFGEGPPALAGLNAWLAAVVFQGSTVLAATNAAQITVR